MTQDLYRDDRDSSPPALRASARNDNSLYRDDRDSSPPALRASARNDNSLYRDDRDSSPSPLRGFARNDNTGDSSTARPRGFARNDEGTSGRVGHSVIRVDAVSRWFGSVVAVSDVTFDITPGITGLLGPNGAGKTTLLRMMTGLAATSKGTITVFGEPVRDNPPLYKRIGVMSEHETVYGFMKGREFVRMMATLRGVTDLERAVDRAIALVDLADAQHRPMDTYSRGMRQRMRLAATLVHDPELLILDEPLNGADPRQRVHFKRLLQQLAAEGRTIVLSSHILEEVEQLADTVLLIVNGKLAASGEFRAIRAALNQRPYHVRVVCNAPRKLAGEIVRLPSVDAVHVDPDGAVVVLSRNVQDLQIELPKLAKSAAISLRRVEPLDDSLESVFGYLVEQ